MKRLKGFWIVCLALTLALATGVLLAGCNKKPAAHTHTADDVWHNDSAEGHYHKCADDGEILDMTDHVLTLTSDGAEGHFEECSVCGYKSGRVAHELKINAAKTAFECECGYTVAHTHDTETVSDGAEGHHVACKTEGCGYTEARESHDLKINADKTAFECDCGYTVAHTHDTETVNDAEQGHHVRCKTEGCGYTEARESHDLKINADKTAFECDCGYTVAHTHDTETVSDAEQGHHVACKTEGCGYVGETTSHTYEGYKQDGIQGHHRECTECDYKTATVGHRNDDNVWEQEDETQHYYECDDCGRKIVDEHTYGAWTLDAETNEHYRVCECGQETGRGAHTFAEGTEYTDKGDSGHAAVCETCEQEVTVAHQYKEALAFTPEGHYQECSICDHTTTPVNHSLKMTPELKYLQSDGSYGDNMDVSSGKNTKQCVHANACEDCGYHEAWALCAEFEYVTDATDHWKECTVCRGYVNGTKGRKEPSKSTHSISTRYDDDTDWQGCSTCGYKQTEPQPHDFDLSKWVHGITSTQDKTLTSGIHYHACKNCSYTKKDSTNCTYQEEVEYKPITGSKPNYQKHYKRETCSGCGGIHQTQDDHVWDEETHTTEDGVWEYHICTLCKQESEHTVAASHKHVAGSWGLDSKTKQHYAVCAQCNQHFDEHDAEYTLEDGWYKGDGVCEHEGCEYSVYEFDAATGTINKYSGDFTKIMIPAQIDGVTVTTIGKASTSSQSAGAFYNKKFTDIILPATVKTLNKYAFANCTSLTSIDLRYVETLASSAFSADTAIKRIVVKANASDSSNTNVFSSCSNIETLILIGDTATNTKMRFMFDRKTVQTVVFDQITMAPQTSDNTFGTVTNVYYGVSKAVYDTGSKYNFSTALQNATHIYYYYAEQPSLHDNPDGVEDSQAWHYGSRGQALPWSETESETHVHSSAKGTSYAEDAENHYKICDDPLCYGAHFDVKPHDWQTLTTADGEFSYRVCTTCNFNENILTATDKHHHASDNSWHDDGKGNHAHICADERCGAFYDAAPHFTVGEDGWYKGDGVCATCGFHALVVTEAGVLSEYHLTFEKVELPEAVDGHTIVEITPAKTNSGFGADFVTKNLKLPASLKTIGLQAFDGATSLVEINLGSVETFGQLAFRNCSGLTQIDLSSAKTFENYAFYGCAGLKSVNISASTVTKCGKYLFQNCTGLLTAVVSVSNESMFNGCSNLKTVVLTGTASIATGIFGSCSSLETVVMETMPAIQKYVIFGACPNVKIYYKQPKSAFDASQILEKDTNFVNGQKFFYYDAKPSTSGSPDGVQDSEAWHFKSGVGEDHYYDFDESGNLTNIELWSAAA